MAYLIDTDILIDVSRANRDAIDYLDQLSDSWTIGIVTALELIVGARDKREGPSRQAHRDILADTAK